MFTTDVSTRFNVIAHSLVLGLAVFAFTKPTPPQESARSLKDTKQTSKYLTHGEIDTWVFEGQKNETVIVAVSSQQFDPVIGLAKVNGESETVMFSVDDEGSQSRFSFRLKEKGTYKIRVHGFEMKGSGNYAMQVRRFVTDPIKFNEPVTRKFRNDGTAGFFFSPTPGTNLVIDSSSSWEVLSPTGLTIAPDWQSNVWLTQKGEHAIVLNGGPGHGCKLTLKPAEVNNLELNDEVTATLDRTSLNIWQLEGKKGQFRMITVTRTAGLQSRFIVAPKATPKEQRLGGGDNYGAIQLLPVASKGPLTQFIVVFTRKGQFQLQCFSSIENEVTVEMTDPTLMASSGESNAGILPIGGARFYGFEAKAGDLIQAQCNSSSFDTWFQLFDELGNQVVNNDDVSPGETNSKLTHMINDNGYYRWRISSIGDGGGGEYDLSFDHLKLKKIKVGQVVQASVALNQTEYLEIELDKDAQLYFDVRSTGFNPQFVLYGPDGRQVGSDQNNGIGNGALLAVKTTKQGRYTLWVSAERGEGEFEVRVVDAK